MNPTFPVFDADTHMYETPDALTRYLPERYKRAIQYVQIAGRTRLAVKDRIVPYIPNPTFERVAAPGAHEAFYAGSNPDGLSLRELTGDPIDSIPAFREPGARLEMLDEQGVQTALVYPTLANLVEQSASDDPDLVHAIIHALNQWIADVWTFDYESRLVPTPVIALPLVDEAIRELDWVLERGAKAILVRPAPVNGYRGFRSPALPEFDPFWAKVEAAGIPVMLHDTFSVLGDYVHMWEPAETGNPFVENPFRMLAEGHRDIHDTLASFICHGTLSRFPKLKIVSVENGTDWVRPLLEGLSHTFKQTPQAYAEDPVDVFRRNVHVTPFWETDVRTLTDYVPVDHILFGSDYPHPEGLTSPLKYLDYMAGLDEEIVRKVMSSNAYSLLSLDEPAA